MATKLFNGACDHCKSFLPGCAAVEWTPPRPGASIGTLCPGCRKALRGRFRLDERHRGKKP